MSAENRTPKDTAPGTLTKVHLSKKPNVTHELPSSVLALDAVREPEGDGPLFAACLDGGVYEVEPASGEAREIGRHESFASGVVLLPDGRVVSAGYDGRVAWRDRAGKTLHEEKAHEFWSWQLAASPDGRRVASVTGQYLCGGYRYEPQPEREPSIRVWDAATAAPVASLPHVPPVLSVAFSPDSRYLAAGNLMGEVRVYDIERQEEVARWTTPSFTGWGIIKGHYYTGGVYSLAFTPDGEELYLGGMGTTRDPAAGNGRQLWQRFAWRESPARKLDETHEGESGQGLMESLRFHPSGDCFVLAGRIHKGTWNAAMFRTEGGQRIGELSSGHRVTSAFFRPDGRRLWLGGAVSQKRPEKGKGFRPFGRIKAWDLELERSL